MNLSSFKLPIIFIHTGSQFYLKNAIANAIAFNPNGNVILLGDKSNAHFEKLFNRQLKHYYIHDFMKLAFEFKDCYIHMSSNHYDYELFCFQRWFIVREFMNVNKFDKVLCLDSDVLLYCDVNNSFDKFYDYDFTICRHSLPCCTLFNSISIYEFTSFVMRLYREENNLKRLELFYSQFFDKSGNRTKLGGVCDMTAFDFYQIDISKNVFELTIPFDGVCFDGIISGSDNFKMKKGIKEIFWIGNQPHGYYGKDEQTVRFLGLHFQGRTKMKQNKFLVDDNGEHITRIPLKMHITIIIAWLKKGISGLKRFNYTIQNLLNVFQIKRNN